MKFIFMCFFFFSFFGKYQTRLGTFLSFFISYMIIFIKIHNHQLRYIYIRVIKRRQVEIIKSEKCRIIF